MRRRIGKVAPWRAAARLSARTPLRVKLIAAVLALVAMGLAVMGVASVSFMHAYLLSRTDEQLVVMLQRFNADPRQPRLGSQLGGPFGPPIPFPGRSIQVRGGDGTLIWPRYLPDNSPGPAISDDPLWLARQVSTPLTLPGTLGDDDWRVRIARTPSGGFVIAGMSLADVNQAIGRLTSLDVSVGGIVLLVLAGAGVAVVRASLRPLVEIEHTAEGIATGDLSRRVPDRDPRTEVGSLGRSLNGMLTQIETAFQARAESEAAARQSADRMRRFVADASHELRTPLSVIRGFAEFYRQRPEQDPAKLGRLLRRVEDEAARMGLLVEDLLLLARVDQQRPLRQDPVDLLAIAADSVHDARLLAPQRSIKLVVAEGVAFIVTGDDVRLRQVVSNLTSNALTHTPDEAPIEVRVRAGSLDGLPATVLEVADKGPGLTPEQAGRAFERFYRADPVRTGGGSGLGLSIVAALVAAHGGVTELDTAAGEGATFRVILPLAPDAVEPETEEVELL